MSIHSGLNNTLSHLKYNIKRYNGNLVVDSDLSSLTPYDTSGGYSALGSFVGQGGLAVGPGFYAIGSSQKQASPYYQSTYGTTPTNVGMVDLIYTDTNNTNQVGVYKTHFPPVADVTASMNYGGAVAIGGGVLAIGAWGAGNGAVYLYRYSASTAEGATSGHFKKLTDSSALAANFGYSVAIGGGRIFVGDPLYNSGQGKVSVYSMSGELLYTLQSPYIGDAAYTLSPGRYGHSLAYHNGKFAVGAPSTQYTISGNTVTEGRVHLYDLNGNLIQNYWPQYADTRYTLGGFGGSITMTQNIIVIGDYSMRANLGSGNNVVGGFYIYPTSPTDGANFISYQGRSKYDNPIYLSYTYVYNTYFSSSASSGPYYGWSVAADGICWW